MACPRVLFVRALLCSGLLLLVACEQTPPVGDGAWVISAGGSLEVEPGRELRLRLTAGAVGLDPDQLVLWVRPGQYDGLRIGPLRVYPAAAGGRDVVVNAPGIVPGEYELQLGDAAAPRSNTLLMKIVAAAPARPKAETAQLLEAGLAALTAEVWSVLNHEDPFLTKFRSEAYAEEFWQGSATFFGGLGALGSKVAEEYLALADDHEPQVRAYLQNIGLLGLLEGLTAPSPVASLGLVSDERTVLNQWLLGLDFLAAYLHTTQIGLDMATLVLVAAGVTIEAGVVTGMVSVVIRTIRYYLQTFVPTDLVAIAPHNSTGTVEKQWVTSIYWGHFRPEEAISSGTVSWGVDLQYEFMKIVLGELLPKPLKPFLKEALGFVLAKIGANVALGPALPVVAKYPGDYFVEQKLALALNLYELKYLELASRFAPFLGAFGQYVQLFLLVYSVFEDPLPALTSTWDPLSSLNSGTFQKVLEQDYIFYEHMPCYDVTPGLALYHLEANGYRFGTRGLPYLGGTYYDAPWIDFVKSPSHHVVVHCPNSNLHWAHTTYPVRFFDIQHTKINQSRDYDGWVLKGSPDANFDRAIRIRVEDASICRSIERYTTISIESSGGTNVGPIVLESGSFETVLSLPAQVAGSVAGDVVVTASTDCQWSGQALLNLRIFFPDAINQNVVGEITGYFIEEKVRSTVEERILVWVPPNFATVE